MHKPEAYEFLFTLATGDDESRRQMLDKKGIRMAAHLSVDDPPRFQELIESMRGTKQATEWRAKVKRYDSTARSQGQKMREEMAAEERLAAASEAGKPIIKAAEPRNIAIDFKALRRAHLTFWRDAWWDYSAGRYTACEDRQVRLTLQDFMASGVDSDTGKDFHPNKRTTDDVMDMLKSQTFVPVDGLSPPFWLNYFDAMDADPQSVIAFPNGLLVIEDGVRRLDPPDPRFFTFNAVPFPYRDDTPPPVEWLKFLESVWPVAEGGQQNHDALQEIMGYLLLPMTRFQKIFMFVGAKRAGKGTIHRVLEGLLGKSNIHSQSVTKLGREFGLKALLGKQLLVVPDLRLGKDANIGGITETLLNMSGEDTMSIGQKHQDDVQVRLHARVVLMSNMGLILPDQSGALHSRLFPLVFHKDFTGREDTTLTPRLLAELPSILHWALDGLERLLARRDALGRQTGFVLTADGKDMLADIARQGSSVQSFIKDCCVMGDEHVIAKEDLFDAFLMWAADNEIRVAYTKEMFARELMTASGYNVKSSKAPREQNRLPIYQGIALNNQWAAGGY